MTEEEVKMEIRKCLTSTYASNIHGVIVVINPTLVGKSQKDVVAKFVKENLPSFIANNMFVVFSNALDSNVEVADIGFPSSQSVCMNNKFFSNPAGSYDTNAMVSAFEIIGAQILWPTLAEMTIPGHLSQQRSLEPITKSSHATIRNQQRLAKGMALLNVSSQEQNCLVICDDNLSMSTVHSTLQKDHQGIVFNVVCLFAFNLIDFDLDGFVIPCNNLIIMSPNHKTKSNSIGSMYYMSDDDKSIYCRIDPNFSQDKNQKPCFTLQLPTLKPEEKLVYIQNYCREAKKSITNINNPTTTQKFNNNLFLYQDVLEHFTITQLIEQYTFIGQYCLVDSDPALVIESYKSYYDMVCLYAQTKKLSLYSDPTISLLLSITLSKINMLMKLTNSSTPVNDIEKYFSVITSDIERLMKGEHQSLVYYYKNEYEQQIKLKVNRSDTILFNLNKDIKSCDVALKRTFNDIEMEFKSMISKNTKIIGAAKMTSIAGLIKNSLCGVGLELFIIFCSWAIPYGGLGIGALRKIASFIQTPDAPTFNLMWESMGMVYAKRKEDGEEKKLEDVNQALKEIAPLVQQTKTTWDEQQKDIEALQKLNEALSLSIEQSLPILRDYLNKNLLALANQQETFAKISHAERKYQVITIGNDYKKVMKEISKVSEIIKLSKNGLEPFINILQDIKQYIRISMEINDKTEEYKDHIQMVNFMANVINPSSDQVNSSHSYIQLLSIETRLNMVLELLESDIHVINSFIKQGVSRIRSNITDNIRKHQFTVYDPYYRWDKTHPHFKESMINLFKGDPINMYSSIDRSQYSSTKLKTVQLVISHKSNAQLSKAIQSSLSSSKVSFSLKHSGDSYYKFDNNLYLVSNEPCTFKYCLSSDNQMISLNATAERLGQSEPLLSPYTNWTFKLTNLPTLEKITNLLSVVDNDFSELELLLIGNGQYVDDHDYQYTKSDFNTLYGNCLI
ncbi:hypothetical protein DFA_05772 [Cavenderia fasciculata]|uniref:Uncharacterized protein n=1 Tax=Cavenderia fasciculata TaxID=261658 RepID=F4PMJ1_CACFS|nr:uncharacterized protein DFA_05772 [Cavenderia fasciculata]EGG23638.1 hypothetical protein DFA_05772 [Cavenderia fasciculata]|eukprot:XP_004361489.1 hypothetical protein DFA_05772 [Cavenderia fasciculata]